MKTTAGRINESPELTELINQHQTNTQIAAVNLLPIWRTRKLKVERSEP